MIGAGQTGLAIGYFLGQEGRRFAVLEAADSIGSAWRDRWDSLTLFTPRRYSGLRASRFPAIQRAIRPRRGDRLPGALRGDVRARDRAEQPVRGLTAEDGRFVLEVDGRTITADQVVVATGPFQKPFVPELANRLGPDLVQMHATGYRKPSDIREGTVLVVGGGNTGFQIAKELSRTHRVALAVGSKQTPLPQRLLGRDLFWWLTKSRLFNTTIDSRLGRRLSTRDTLIGSSPRELRRRYGVELKPRVVGADGVRCGSRAGARSKSTWSFGRPDTGPTSPGSTSPSSTRPAGSATGEA